MGKKKKTKYLHLLGALQFQEGNVLLGQRLDHLHIEGLLPFPLMNSPLGCAIDHTKVVLIRIAKSGLLLQRLDAPLLAVIVSGSQNIVLVLF